MIEPTNAELAEQSEIDAAILRSLLNAIGVFQIQQGQAVRAVDVMGIATIFDRAAKSWSCLERLESAASLREQSPPPTVEADVVREALEEAGAITIGPNGRGGMKVTIDFEKQRQGYEIFNLLTKATLERTKP